MDEVRVEEQATGHSPYLWMEAVSEHHLRTIES